MKVPLLFTILLWITNSEHVSGEHNLFSSIQDDLKNLNARCPPYDTCLIPRSSETLHSYNCHCSAVCSLLDTCCIDSTYDFVKPPQIKPTCRSVGGDRAYFMVDRCPPRDSNGSMLESFCQEEWNGDDDVLKTVPVTSLFSRITYKNYYCFRCHETTDDFLYWNVKLGSSNYEFHERTDESNPTVHYANNEWVAPLGKGMAMIPVNLTVECPKQISSLPVFCDADLISNCSDEWKDKDVSDKCKAYMATVQIDKNDTFARYRNVHCALCNFEELKDVTCKQPSSVAFSGKKQFSFTHLLDINRSDGDKVGKREERGNCGVNSTWDPFSNSCKQLGCGVPGYQLINGKCTPP